MKMEKLREWKRERRRSKSAPPYLNLANSGKGRLLSLLINVASYCSRSSDFIILLKYAQVLVIRCW